MERLVNNELTILEENLKREFPGHEFKIHFVANSFEFERKCRIVVDNRYIMNFSENLCIQEIFNLIITSAENCLKIKSLTSIANEEKKLWQLDYNQAISNIESEEDESLKADWCDEQWKKDRDEAFRNL